MSERISISLHPKIVSYLDILAATGLFGLDREETAENLLRQAIEGQMTDGAEPIKEALQEACIKPLE